LPLLVPGQSRATTLESFSVQVEVRRYLSYTRMYYILRTFCLTERVQNLVPNFSQDELSPGSMSWEASANDLAAMDEVRILLQTIYVIFFSCIIFTHAQSFLY
jgi:hypothetical protein